MKMSVGRVIFVLSKESHSVVPCRIVEIVSSVTLEGETKTHIIEAPGGKKRIRLEDHDAPWFDTFDAARSYLLNAANALVDQTMNRALKVAQKSFDFTVESQVTSHSEGLDSDLNDLEDTPKDTQMSFEETEDSLYVDMAGQKVKVTLPKELINV